MLLTLASRYWRKAREQWWPAAQNYLRVTPKKQLAAIGSVALASAIAGYFGTSLFLYQPEAEATEPLTIRTIEAPQQPKLSWITYTEQQHAQDAGQPLLDISPAELLSRYEREGDAAIDMYRDGWVKLDYPIASFDRQTFKKASYDVIEAKAHFNSVFPGKIIAIFNAQKWHMRLATHRVGDQIVAFCQFKDIDREQVLPNIQQLSFYAIRCDLPQQQQN